MITLLPVWAVFLSFLAFLIFLVFFCGPLLEDVVALRMGLFGVVHVAVDADDRWAPEADPSVATVGSVASHRVAPQFNLRTAAGTGDHHRRWKQKDSNLRSS